MKTKKDLTAEYKQMKFSMGVFQIRNTINDKIYVESSVNLDKIWNRHKLELDFGGHRNTELQSDWKKYGADAFKFEILAELEPDPMKDDKRELKLLEELYLEELQPFDEKGYNRRKRN